MTPVINTMQSLFGSGMSYLFDIEQSGTYVERGKVGVMERQDIDNVLAIVRNTEGEACGCRIRKGCPKAVHVMFRNPCFPDSEAGEVGSELWHSEECSSPVPTNAQHRHAPSGHDDMTDVAEGLHVDLRREVLVDRANIVEYAAEDANAAFVLGYRIVCCGAEPLAKEKVVVLILGDPRQASLLDPLGASCLSDTLSSSVKRDRSRAAGISMLVAPTKG